MSFRLFHKVLIGVPFLLCNRCSCYDVCWFFFYGSDWFL